MENDAALGEEHSRFRKLGIEVSAIQDAIYSKQFHFRDPDGHICALSTPNRFTIDEDAAVLGAKLCLPKTLEKDRRMIEQHIAYRPAPVPVLR